VSTLLALLPWIALYCDIAAGKGGRHGAAPPLHARTALHGPSLRHVHCSGSPPPCTAAEHGPFIGGQQPCSTDLAVWPRLYHMQVGRSGCAGVVQCGALLKGGLLVHLSRC